MKEFGMKYKAKKDKATLNQEEIEKLKEELKQVKDTLGKVTGISLSNSSFIKGIVEGMSKLVKMLCDPNYEKEKK